MRELTPIYCATMPSRFRATLMTYLAIALVVGAVGAIVSLASA